MRRPLPAAAISKCTSDSRETGQTESDPYNQAAEPVSSAMRALFLIPGGSSQQLQSFAAVAAVADQLHAEVHVVCPVAAVPLWSLHPAVKRAMPFTYEQATLADWANLMGSVREPDFQVSLNLAPSRQMDLMLSMSHIPTRVASGGFSATERITPMEGGWPNQAFEAFLRPIGVRLEAESFRLPIAPADLEAASAALPVSSMPRGASTCSRSSMGDSDGRLGLGRAGPASWARPI
jgi:hypothetical protein